MTGRELIIYILQNHLEDEPVIKDGKLMGFGTVKEIAVRKNVGEATICALIGEGRIPFETISNTVQIPLNSIERSK